ncbi:MAG: riboflavin synthase [Nanoarchaeota archaeon]|nr:riboflavin synthase [Nanoarchaeota archaeon]
MKIGIADTMFSTIDMFIFAEMAIKDSKSDIVIERYTVPGFKDLPVAAKKLIEEFDCSIVVALGMAGKEEIDRICATEASSGLIQAELLTNTHILKVFVHMDEASSNEDLIALTKDRVYKHTENAIALMKGKTELSKEAGKGIRQGREDVGGVE